MSNGGIPNSEAVKTSSSQNRESQNQVRSGQRSNQAEKVVHSCRTCNRDIVDECYIQCTRCKGFFQCLECFSVGAESIDHINKHPFILMPPSLDPIFSENWTIEEELMLLHAISLCGVGNWSEIARQMKTKNEEECQIHYFGVYIDTINAPFPEIKMHEPFAPLPKLPFNTNPQESNPSDGHEKNLALQGKKEKTTPGEYCGYMPKRHEFEDEYLDDAEHIIDGIVFDENETFQSLEQKLQYLEGYNSAIQERKFRTKLVEDWGIQDLKFKSLGGF